MLLVLGGVAFLVLYGLAIIWAPNFFGGALLHDPTLDARDRLSAEQNTRVLVTSIGGAFAIAIGLIYTAQKYALDRRGQANERFVKALERLGDPELFVRAGAVRALHHVMLDSPRHHDEVLSVLVSFVRQRAPHVHVTKEDSRTWMHPPGYPVEQARPSEPDADVQAALTVISERPLRRERTVIDFRGLHLQGANLAAARFDKAEISQCDLTGSILTGVKFGARVFSETCFDNALLVGVDFRDSLLLECSFKGANIDHADFSGVHTSKVSFRHVYGNKARFKEADLVGCDLGEGFFRKADFLRADLRNANLSDSVSRYARWVDAKLEGANVSNAFMWPLSRVEIETWHKYLPFWWIRWRP